MGQFGSKWIKVVQNGSNWFKLANGLDNHGLDKYGLDMVLTWS